MGLNATYLGMPLDVNELDVENIEYFRHCAAHAFHLQQCAACGLVRYPPTTACPWCAELSSRWVPVEGRGSVHSYTEVHHAIQQLAPQTSGLPSAPSSIGELRITKISPKTQIA